MNVRSVKYQPAQRRSVAQARLRRILFLLMSIAILACLKVWQKVNVDHQNRFNGKLQAQLTALEGENALLEARIEELRSRERLGDVAREQLHLVPVPAIVLEEKSVLDKLTKKLEEWQR